MMLPIVVALASSTHDTQQLVVNGLQVLPGGSGPENYREVLTRQSGFTDQITAADMLWNSLIVGLAVATLTTAFSLCASYALVFFKLPVAGFLFWVTLLTLLFPIESRFVTTFQVTAALELVNSYAGMVLPVLACALGTLFFRQFLLGMPEEYLEAAKLDAAGPVRFFLDFVVPLSWRHTGAIFVVTFMIGWNQYLWPLMVTTGESHYTLVRGIRLIGQESGPGMALVVLTILPPLILLMIFQKWFLGALRDP